MNKCDYCGDTAVYQLKNGRWCCKKSSNSCPAQRAKNSHSCKNSSKRFTHSRSKYSEMGKSKSWNSGKTYEEVLGKRKANEYRRKQSIAAKKNETGGCLPDAVAEKQRRDRISRANKGKTGGYKPGSGRSKGKWYESKFAGRVYLDSSYEVFYASYLDEQGVRWKKNKIKFPYEHEGIKRYYIPDFYLVDTNEFIETKGYATERDKSKWRDFPFKLTVLFSKDLQKLGFTGRIR